MKRVVVGLLLALFCLWLFLAGLGDRDLNSSHEARAAQNAQRILDEGAWALPRLFDGKLELQKPPLYYWLVAAFGWIAGVVDEWAVRLPAALSALGCVGLLVWWGRRIGRPEAGLVAGVILATSVHFTWLGRVGRIDMPLTLAVAASLFAFSTRWPILGYTALAAGVLLKGPIALFLVAAVAGLTWIVERTPPPRRLLWGVPWMLALTLPWFVWANYATNNKIWDVFVWYHNVERGLGSDALSSHPVWFYLVRIWADLFPWSLAIPALIVAARRWHLWEDREFRRGACWFLGIFVFLSCMRFKRADYLLPAFPGFAWMMAVALEKAWERSPQFRRRGVMAVAGLAVAMAAGWQLYAMLTRDAENWTSRQLALAIRNQTNAPVIFFRVETHPVAFHVGRPLDTILEWENLEIWASEPRPIYFVMPPDCADSWRRHLEKAQLEEVFRKPAPGQPERMLVVMRSIVEVPNLQSRETPLAVSRQWPAPRSPGESEMLPSRETASVEPAIAEIQYRRRLQP